jgi:hypothetical protein
VGSNPTLSAKTRKKASLGKPFFFGEEEESACALSVWDSKGWRILAPLARIATLPSAKRTAREAHNKGPKSMRRMT